MPHKFIAIEGNIGAGKTSLAIQLAKSFNCPLILEEFDENPFLAKFYSNPEKYALPLELSFLTDRYNQLKNEMAKEHFQTKIVSDYFFLKSMIFASGNLNIEEKQLYSQLMHILGASLPLPDLLVYMHQDVENLLNNIKKRGRLYEQNIKADYLKRIEEGYFDFFEQNKHLKILVLDLNAVNFVDNSSIFHLIEDAISQEYECGIVRKTINVKG